MARGPHPQLPTPQKPLALRIRAFQRTNTYRTLRAVLIFAIALTFIDVLRVRHALTQEQEDAPELGKEKIFVASIFWNSEDILRTHWMPGMFELAADLGSENLFVSIQESGSWDDSKGALLWFQTMLQAGGIQNRILLDPTTHQDEIERTPAETGWIRTPRGKMELRRIPYLARLRNLVLEPLYEMQKQGKMFDKILFLNDVAFDIQDVRRLVATRGGDYAAACSLDMKHPPLVYDTLALRDADGQDLLTQTWPFFRSRQSRSAVKMGNPVPVTSCWNGMVAMDAAPFYEDKLAFRGIPDSLGEAHLEGSECCLIHADNPLTQTKGVWLNPHVRVAYDGFEYHQIKTGPPWLSTWTILKATWTNRILRWITTDWFKNRIVNRRLARWREADPAHKEDARFCLINEMQVLIENGWKHL